MGTLNDNEFFTESETNGGGFIKSLNLKEAANISDIQDSVKILLQGLGEDSNREGLVKTPLRVAKALREGTRGYRQKVKDIVQGALFPEAGLDGGVGQAGGAGGLVVVRDLDLFSYCESCLLPFRVKCHVGYVPSGQQVVGLSKLSRVADVFAKRLQEPQRLANEICSALQNEIKPAGVGVVLQCWHIQFPQLKGNCPNQVNHCTEMDMLGWSMIPVCASSGGFTNKNGDIWSDFTALLKFRGVKVETLQNQPAFNHSWCPSLSLDVQPIKAHKNTSNHSNGKIPTDAQSPSTVMVSAVASILQSLGENPSRKELVGTPNRFVQWLMNFKCSNMEMSANHFNSDVVDQRPKNNPTSVGQDEFRAELNLPFWSQCEHHLLPFHGLVHIGYFHAEGCREIARTILQTIVHFHGWKLQVQERLTRQIVETISSTFGVDVMVVVEANHICMISRGIEKVGSSTATIATAGRFSSDPTAKEWFLQTISSSNA
ncbi:GTP cyclohydrolase I [Ranunculus cassubicifolius]